MNSIEKMSFKLCFLFAFIIFVTAMVPSEDFMTELAEMEEKTEFETLQEMVNTIFKLVKIGSQNGCDIFKFVQSKSFLFWVKQCLNSIN